MINRLTLVGRVGEEPITHTFDSGKQVSKFSIATSEKYKNKDGEKVEDTEWHNIVTYNLAGIVEKYVHKGDLLFLEGKVKTRSYDDKEGNKKYITEVICYSMQMLGSKDKPKPETKPETTPEVNMGLPEEDDIPPPELDDIPF